MPFQQGIHYFLESVIACQRSEICGFYYCNANVVRATTVWLMLNKMLKQDVKKTKSINNIGHKIIYSKHMYICSYKSSIHGMPTSMHMYIYYIQRRPTQLRTCILTLTRVNPSCHNVTSLFTLYRSSSYISQELSI
jgi:hypothetical protein